MTRDRSSGPSWGRAVGASVIGAIVGVLLFALPGSTILGGAVAGYLLGQRGSSAAVTGAVAGVLMYLPVAVIVGGLGMFGFTGVASGVLLIGMVIYTVALATIGGLIGGYLNHAVSGETAGTGYADSRRHSGRPLLYGAIGGVASVILVFIPYSTVVGGAIAGYLHGGTIRDGAVVGTVAGVVALLPLILIGILAVTVLGVLGGLAGVAIGVVLVLVFGFGLIYVIVLSIIGGIIGSVIRAELS